jgi:multidrug resistance efflux pump
VPSGQFIDLGAVNTRIKAKVEVVQQTRLTEVGQFVTPVKEPLMADIDLVLEQKLEELRIGQPIGFSLLQTQIQALK